MIYLATPYTHQDPRIMEKRFKTACRIAGRLMRQGHIVFCPIVHSHPIAVECGLPRDWEYWQKLDEKYILVCDRFMVALMPGWESSKGIEAEINIAKKLGRKIEYVAGRQRTSANNHPLDFSPCKCLYWGDRLHRLKDIGYLS